MKILVGTIISFMIAYRNIVNSNEELVEQEDNNNLAHLEN
jgi:hypothetical protein